MGKRVGIYCKTWDRKVSENGHQSDKKKKKKKTHTKVANISGKVQGERDQGMVKYGTPPEEVHPEAQK